MARATAEPKLSASLSLGYRAALAAEPTSGASKGPQAGSIEWAIKRYMASSAWAGLSPATRRARENIFHQITEAAGDKMLSQVTQRTIIGGREKRAKTPHAANNYLKAMRGLFGWAAGDGGLVKVNPALGVKLLKGANDAEGFHTWTEEEVARFEEAWPLGTRERLALDILLYTGLRRGDAAKLGRQHVRDGVITIRTEKTGEVVSLPVLEPLARSIAATTTGDLTFLITERGAPFAKESFGNWFKKACVKAKVPGSAHGLRKAGATRAAENGARARTDGPVRVEHREDGRPLHQGVEPEAPCPGGGPTAATETDAEQNRPYPAPRCGRKR